MSQTIDAIVKEYVTLPWAHELNAARRRVILELLQELGPTTFRAWDSFLAAMASRDFDEAAHEILIANLKGDADEWALMMRTGIARYAE